MVGALPTDETKSYDNLFLDDYLHDVTDEQLCQKMLPKLQLIKEDSCIML